MTTRTPITPRLATHTRKRVDALVKGERLWFQSSFSWETATACGPAVRTRSGSWELSIIDETTGSGGTLRWGPGDRAPFAYLAGEDERGWNAR